MPLNDGWIVELWRFRMAKVGFVLLMAFYGYGIFKCGEWLFAPGFESYAPVEEVK